MVAETCENCGEEFEADDFPMYCPLCESWFALKEEDGSGA